MTARDSLLSIAPIATGEILVVAGEEMRSAVCSHLSMLGLAIAHADTFEQTIAISTEKSDTLDCVVLDMSTPGVDMYDLAGKLRSDAQTVAIPVVAILSRAPSEIEMLKLIEAGVMDHVSAPLSGPLFTAKVKAACERSRMQRELKNKLRFALESAAHDPLTGLYNRRYFERRLKEETAHARRHRKPFALVMLDLDHFKVVNDTYGHEDGDRVLKHVAEVVGDALREDDLACRIGGEEMVLLLRATSAPAARIVANRVRTMLSEKKIALGAKKELKQITFSAGVAAADERNDFDATDIVARADKALYRAKRAGRNRVEME